MSGRKGKARVIYLFPQLLILSAVLCAEKIAIHGELC